MSVTEEIEVLPADEALLEQVASQLDLREPNREAVEVLALRMRQWFELDREEFFEGVIDSATGVGKTYIIAGAIDYYAAQGIRNFAVIAPGSTILNKTVAQFTPGPKSLLPLMATKPKVITSENFRTSAVAAALEDDDQVKLFVFTVQALTKPTNSKVGKRTHEFQEGLGGKFYEHLDDLDDLIVFADEHHCYFGPAFSKAVRDLTPLGLVGLTGTPHKKTAEEEIIFRYPLTAAIADEYVKTPVLVGRKDDRTDEQTQLLDGATILMNKEKALQNYCKTEGIDFVHPIMLVNCRDIDHAKETVNYLTSDQFLDGKFSGDGVVLEVHSNQADKALEALEHVEETGNPCRVIVQVGMLKEGWDVKNVYVIASLRASVSEILTEQTLGRGLRLPFGKYTSMPLLNELDVLAHERYEDLLKRTGTLQESFIDKRTKIERFVNVDGDEEVGVTTETVKAEVDSDQDQPAAGVVSIGDTESRVKDTAAAAKDKPLKIRDEAPEIEIPAVKTIPKPQPFKLSQITDLAAFREVGHGLATDPEEYLTRTKLGGMIEESQDGQRLAEITTDPALQEIRAAEVRENPETAKAAVIKAVMADRSITKRRGEGAMVAKFLDAVLDGAGEKADIVLSCYQRALVAKIIRQIRQEKKALGNSTQTTEEVILQPFTPARLARKPTSKNRKGGKFKPGLAYIGWEKNLFDQAWFDSGPERDAANLLDEAKEIEAWLRLHQNDLPILWQGAEKTYNPDLLAIATDGSYWIIETKSDKDLPTSEVQEKRKAALEWANTVSSETGTKWNYLLVAERDLQDAKGSWKRLSKATVA